MLNLKNLSEKQALTYTIMVVIVLCLIPTGLLIALQHESGQGIFSQLMDNPESLTIIVQQKQEERNRVEAVLAKEKGLIEVLKGLEDEADRYKKALPDADNLESIYKLIGDVMSASKIKVKSVRHVKYDVKIPPKPIAVAAADPADKNAPALPPPPPPPKVFPINYIETIWSFEGNYQDILNGIHKIEDVDFERFVIVSDFRLAPAVDPVVENNLDWMSGEVTFVCFYYVKELAEGSK